MHPAWRPPGALALPPAQGCPKCAARDALRRAYLQPPGPRHYRRRTRDGALWCYVHDECFYRVDEVDLIGDAA